MAENINSGVNRYVVDIATGGGNTILGTAVPTNVATQGISKTAGESGVFVYTDKSFTVYLCYGSTWVEYMVVNSEDADFGNNVSIPWAAHSTHGAVTAMYFLTAEADHEIRLIPLMDEMITDFIPTDGVVAKNAIIAKDADITFGTGVITGDKVNYSPPGHSMAGKSAGETFSYTLNGQVGRALTMMNNATQVKTTIVYDSETGKSTISFVLPAGYNGSQVFKTHTKGGSPLADPFTRSVTIPTTGLKFGFKPEQGLNSGGTAVGDTEGVWTWVNFGSGSDMVDTSYLGTYHPHNVHTWDYIDGGNNTSFGTPSHVPSIDWSSNWSNTLNLTENLNFDNGITVATAFLYISNRNNHIGQIFRVSNDVDSSQPTSNRRSISCDILAATSHGDSKKLQIQTGANAGAGKIYQTDDACITPYDWHTIVVTWDSDVNNAPILKVDGVVQALTQTSTGNYYDTSWLWSSGYYSSGDFTAYENLLSGTDLEQLEAYMDFKYITMPTEIELLEPADTEYPYIWHTRSWTDVNGIRFPDANLTYSTFVSKKTITIGTRGYFEWTMDASRHATAQVAIVDAGILDSIPVGNSINVAGAIMRVYCNTGNFNTGWYDNGTNVGGLSNPLHNNQTFKFQVEWDGEWSLWQGGNKFYTSPNKITASEVTFLGYKAAGDVDSLKISSHEGEYINYKATPTTPMVLTSAGSVDSSARINGNVFSPTPWNGTTQLVSVPISKGDYIEIDGYAHFNMSTNAWGIHTTGTGHTDLYTNLFTSATPVGGYEKWGGWRVYESGTQLGTAGKFGYYDSNLYGTTPLGSWGVGFNMDGTVTLYIGGLKQYTSTHVYTEETVYLVMNAVWSTSIQAGLTFTKT